jgi:hypothetical protein
MANQVVGKVDLLFTHIGVLPACDIWAAAMPLDRPYEPDSDSMRVNASASIFAQHEGISVRPVAGKSKKRNFPN